MTRNLLRIPFSLIQVARVHVPPISQNGGCFRPSPSPHLSKTYSSSSISQQDKNSKQATTDDLPEQAEDRSAHVGTTTSEHKEGMSNERIRSTPRFSSRRLNLSPVSPADTTEFHTNFSTEFESWILKTLRNNPHEKASDLFEAANDIYLRTLSSRPGNTAINVAFRNPSAANALTSPLLERLTKTFNKIASTESITGVCLTSGDATVPDVNFSSGAHVRALSSIQGQDEAETFIRQISDLCTAIRNTPVPVVALISGSCIGAGLEVAASCDIRVATRDAKFSMPEVHLKIPSVVQARLLCDIVGWGRARHLMLTGYTWTAQEAYEAGLITKLFDSKHSMMNWGKSYMKQVNGDNEVYRTQKKLMKDWENQSVDEGIEAGVQCFRNAFATKNRTSHIQSAIQRAIAMRKRAARRPVHREGSQDEDNASTAEDQADDEVQNKDNQQTTEEQSR